MGEKIVKLMTKWETTHPHITEEERTDVLDKVETVRTWISEKEEDQSKLAGSDEPALSSEPNAEDEDEGTEADEENSEDVKSEDASKEEEGEAENSEQSEETNSDEL